MIKWIFTCLIFIGICTVNVKAQSLKDTIVADSLTSFCYSLKGIPYKYGGSSLKGFDCSGFIGYVFNRFGINVGHSSGYLATLGKSVPLNECKAGDIIVFTGTNSKKRSPGHVGIIVNKQGEEIEFIHASSAKKESGVKITNYQLSNYPIRFLQIRRIAVVE